MHPKTVSGTEGKQVQVYVDFTSNTQKGNIILFFPQLICVNKITIME